MHMNELVFKCTDFGFSKLVLKNLEADHPPPPPTCSLPVNKGTIFTVTTVEKDDL
jgi:hypothetical protein